MGESKERKLAPVKAEATKCVAWAVEKAGYRLFLQSKLLAKTLACVAAMLYDRNKHTRAYARAVVHAMVRACGRAGTTSQPSH